MSCAVLTVLGPGVSGACINEGGKDVVLGHLGKVHAADDLEKAHGHRDIKPSHLMIWRPLGTLCSICCLASYQQSPFLLVLNRIVVYRCKCLMV
jgi:hypothetical protein